jgi:aminoglycoside phosphotransferase (APT) family kinase protein
VTPDAIARIEHALGRPVASVRTLGRGTDHTALQIDGDLVARISRDGGPDAGAQIAREARLLELVGSVLPIAVPEVVAVDPPAGLLIVTRLPGVSLLDRPSPEPRRLVPQLAALLAGLRDIPTDRTDGIVDLDDVEPRAWLDEAAATYALVAHRLDRAHREHVERFLAEPPPPPPPPARLHVLCHNDLGAEHLLTGDHDAITGVLDWSDAARADLAVDLGRLARDLGPSTATEIGAQLDVDAATIRRASFYARCTLLEDLHFGSTTGDHRYRDAAIDNLIRTFTWSAT